MLRKYALFCFYSFIALRIIIYNISKLVLYYLYNSARYGKEWVELNLKVIKYKYSYCVTINVC